MHSLIILLLILSIGCTHPTAPTEDCIVNGITVSEYNFQEWRIIDGRHTLITVWQPATKYNICVK